MLASHRVSSFGADETSTRTTKARKTQVVPGRPYDFGDGYEHMKSSAYPKIQPMPVTNVVQVRSGAVAPHSLPGASLPKDTAVLPTGEMRCLGEPVGRVMPEFVRGVRSSKKVLKGNTRDLRKVGGALVPMAAPARDVERDPITRDGNLNRSAGTVAVARFEGDYAPDDRIRARALTPKVRPGTMINLHAPIYRHTNRPAWGGGAEGGSPIGDASTDQAAQSVGRTLVEGIFFVGAAAAAIVGGIWYLSKAEE